MINKEVIQSLDKNISGLDWTKRLIGNYGHFTGDWDGLHELIQTLIQERERLAKIVELRRIGDDWAVLDKDFADELDSRISVLEIQQGASGKAEGGV